jgi:hypothetical protein
MIVCTPHTGAEAKCEQSHTLTHTQGGIEAVVTAMGRHAENETLQEEACETLGNLAKQGEGNLALLSVAINDKNKAKIGAQVENINEYI